MIEREFEDTEGAEAAAFSHGDFGFFVEALHDAAGNEAASTNSSDEVKLSIAQLIIKILNGHSAYGISLQTAHSIE